MTAPADTTWLSSSRTVNELLQRHPDVLPVLHELGVHTCCGGGLSLAVAAEKAGITQSLLLERVSDAIADDAGGAG